MTKVHFSRVDEYLEELRAYCENNERNRIATDNIVRRTIRTRTMPPYPIVRAAVVCGIIVKDQLIELEHDLGEFMSGAKEIQAKADAVFKEIEDFAEKHGLETRAGMFKIE